MFETNLRYEFDPLLVHCVRIIMEEATTVHSITFAQTTGM